MAAEGRRTRLATRLARKLDELGFDVTLADRKAAMVSS
jgi:menaquinone-dependent protoporphyrinogen IX oxidase